MKKEKLATTRESHQLWTKHIGAVRIGVEYEPSFLGLGIHIEGRDIFKLDKSEPKNKLIQIVVYLFVLEINISVKVGEADEQKKNKKDIKKA